MKIKKISIILFLMLIIFNINAQKVKIIYENYSYHITDSITGKHIKTLNYDRVWDFSEGFACINLFNKWGFIDSTGKEIVTPKYDKVYSFKEGFAPVCIGGKWGYIDKSGKEVIPLKYDDVMGFSNGKANVTLYGRYYIIDKTGKEIDSK